MTIATTIYRSDYQIYPYDIESIDLEFSLDENCTKVTQTMRVRSKQESSAPMVLKGEGLALLSISVNQQILSPNDYTLSESELVLHNLPSSCEIVITNTNCPKNNLDLMGLFVSKDSIFTQCEAEGFRKITYHPDRPDVLSVYTVTIHANAERYPVLLSNGNLISEQIQNQIKTVVWHDPYPKPSYLFALVGGQFACRESTLTTPKGKTCLLQIYSDTDSYEKTEFALTALKQSILWDEHRFDLSIDLERFMIVATRDFSMGAMENKGLNIFNSAYVLAHSETSTDQNFLDVQAVIGHEYFHNWTGNRITCRDWFQLSLKEGLTVFRDQEFSADQLAEGLSLEAARSAKAVKRIEDVKALRLAQFPEDAGPMAHPIRPESYQSIDNFYTATIYEKGAEVIRMLHTLMGEELFQKGMKIYVERHDGQAVTCDDFVDAMETALQSAYPEKNFTIFKRWYSQAGTPTVHLSTHYNPEAQKWSITAKQSCPLVGVENTTKLIKQPFHIPLIIGAYTSEGQSCLLNAQASILLELTTEEQTWHFDHITQAPILSVLHGFSAPVYIDYSYTTPELRLLAEFDTDPFARYEALQTIYRQIILHHEPIETLAESYLLSQLLHSLMSQTNLDPGYLVELLTLPSVKFLAELKQPIDPLLINDRTDTLETWIGKTLAPHFLSLYRQYSQSTPYSLTASAIGQRSLRNTALRYLLASRLETTHSIELAHQQYFDANNFTDRWAALSGLSRYATTPQFQPLLDDFYQRYQNDPLVIDKWFTLQALAPNTKAKQIQSLTEHPDFKWDTPNRVRALLFQFCIYNPQGFFAADCSGYHLFETAVLKLDAINPAIAARLARTLDRWRMYHPNYQQPMQETLIRLANTNNLSNNLNEILSKSLEHL